MKKKTRIDMHCHTTGSDGHGTPEQYVQYAKQAKLDGLIITDHHKTFTKDGHAVVQALNNAGIFSFLGCEFSTKEGHLLIYGPDVERDLGLKGVKYPPMQAVIDLVVERGGVAIPAHPYKGYRSVLRDKVYELQNVPALEQYNGQNQAREPNKDEPTRKAVQKMGLKAVGNSDAHFVEHVGICWTEFDGVIDTKQKLVHALWDGAYKPKRDTKRLDADRAYKRRKQAKWEADRVKRVAAQEASSVVQMPFWETYIQPEEESVSWADEAAEVQRALEQYGQVEVMDDDGNYVRVG